MKIYVLIGTAGYVGDCKFDDEGQLVAVEFVVNCASAACFDVVNAKRFEHSIKHSGIEVEIMDHECLLQ